VTYVLTFFGGIAGAAIAMALTVLGFELLSVGSATTMDRATAVIFVFAPMSGLAGLLGGVWGVLRLRGTPTFGRVVAHSVVAVLAAVAMTIIGTLVLQNTGDILRPNQASLQLEFEIMLPPRTQLPPRLNTIKVDLETDKNTMPADLAEPMTRREGERPVIGGTVDVYFKTAQRSIRLKIPNEPDRIFRLTLAASPSLSKTLSPWTHVDLIDDRKGEQPRKAQPEERYDIRHRVFDPTEPR
jgi:hypothetical protein